VSVAVLLLSTAANDSILRTNRAAFAGAFRGSARELQLLLDGASPTVPPWTLAMIDPRSKARRWCRPTVLQGRRAPPAYLHYADAVRAITSAARCSDRRDHR
jgi:hypothetical protein